MNSAPLQPATEIPPMMARDRAARIWIAIAGVLVIVLGIAALYTWRSGDTGSGGDFRPTERLENLPARPEEIETQGKRAESILEPADARTRNAAVPIASAPIDIARPFVFSGSDPDRLRALDCLATAALYEAGDDSEGQAAVAQVVLNRVRHAAFPATICGVVYQGSQRSTGCQFTFTCDGSLARKMSDAAWRRAREVSSRALAGWVDRGVGLATHYHTDWVYPYWSPELRKLARVGTHLFFGWPGSWGGPKAFGRTYRGNEAGAAPLVEATMAPVDPDLGGPKILGLPQAPAKLPAGMGKVPLYGARLRLSRADGRAFGLLATPGMASSSLVNAALALCEQPGPCQVLAWSNEDDIPGDFPIPQASKGTMVFEYARDGAGSRGTLRFDCGRYPNRDPKLCMEGARLPPELSGVRWKPE